MIPETQTERQKKMLDRERIRLIMNERVREREDRWGVVGSASFDGKDELASQLRRRLEIGRCIHDHS